LQVGTNYTWIYSKTEAKVLKLIALGMFVLGAQLAVPAQTAIQPKPSNDVKSAVGAQNYDKLVLRLKALNRDIESKGIHDFPGVSGKMLTGYAYGEYYDWDLYFENIYLSYYGESKYDFTNIKVFLDREKPDGFISRTVGITYPRPRQMFKPFLAQIAVLGSKQNGDSYEWLRDRYYERLQKYLQRWFAYDTDKNGLPVWNSSDASGMDNQISRAGDLDTYQDEGVDLACELYRELQAMEVISAKLGKTDDAKMYVERAAKLAKDINAVFWDEKDGFYYDRDQKTGKQIRVKSIAGFFPLWAGVASPKQADRLVHEHLLNANEFWLKYPIATYAKTEPDFYEGSKTGECNWQGPAWIPINYVIFHGLVQYGYTGVARELAVKTLDMALNENEATREYYNSDTGNGNGMNPFWGWSSLAYVMLIDLAEHYDPMDLHGTVRPLISEDLGVEFK
jgi:putative isomerase